MKLKYIVNANLDDNYARAIQIKSNSKMFSKIKNVEFECVAVGDSNENFEGVWVNNIKRESSWIRKVLFHALVVSKILNSDVVYSRNLTVLFLVVLLRRDPVWEIHDSVGRVNAIILKFIKSKLKVVAITDALKSYLVNEMHIAKEKILVAHDGVFLEKYEALRASSKVDLRQQLNLPEKAVIVMHTGSLYKGRGAELFEVIAKNFPAIYFVQVGGKVKDVEYWSEYYSSFDNVLFIGHQENETLVRYQMAADLLFLPMTKSSPIWWCSSPMKLFEYMATGNPILTSNIGSVTEVLSDKNSIVFDPDEKRSIVDGVNQFLNGKADAKKLAELSLYEARNEYAWDKRINKIFMFINKC